MLINNVGLTLTGYRWEHKIKYLLNPPKEMPFKPVRCLHEGSRVFQSSTFTRKRNLLGQQSPEVYHYTSQHFWKGIISFYSTTEVEFHA